jgi:SAM-dependent methyltransferase
LLDAGCGPAMATQQLRLANPGKFQISAFDLSPAMVAQAVIGFAGAEDVRLLIARIENMPFNAGEFDVVLALGVLEYVNVRPALTELARVTHAGGEAVVSMLNPMSPYRIWQWRVYQPAVRLAGRLERLLGVRRGREHDAAHTGICALSSRKLLKAMRSTGWLPRDVVYYDVTPLVPPIDRLVRRWARQWRTHPERTVSRGWFRWFGTAYLVTAHRAAE